MIEINEHALGDGIEEFVVGGLIVHIIVYVIYILLKQGLLLPLATRSIALLENLGEILAGKYCQLVYFLCL